jgi:hypothetical protein
MRRLFWSAGLIAALASPAFADTEQHKEGDYGGVVPGQKPDAGTKPPKPKRAPAKGTLTWIGFEAKDGGAQLFFQSVSPFELSQKVSGGQLVVTLNLTRLAANTWRKIDTRFFDNPLAGATARKKGRGIEVKIAFKNAKDLRDGTVRTATEADGMYYAYLTFPEGTATSTSSGTKDEPEK